MKMRARKVRRKKTEHAKYAYGAAYTALLLRA